jgi:hypothetical protein
LLVNAAPSQLLSVKYSVLFAATSVSATMAQPSSSALSAVKAMSPAPSANAAGADRDSDAASNFFAENMNTLLVWMETAASVWRGRVGWCLRQKSRGCCYGVCWHPCPMYDKGV